MAHHVPTAPLISMEEAMTKEQFRRLAHDAVETLLSMPDDLWESGFPMLSLKHKGSEEAVFVGIKETNREDDA